MIHFHWRCPAAISPEAPEASHAHSPAFDSNTHSPAFLAASHADSPKLPLLAFVSSSRSVSLAVLASLLSVETRAPSPRAVHRHYLVVSSALSYFAIGNDGRQVARGEVVGIADGRTKSTKEGTSDCIGVRAALDSGMKDGTTDGIGDMDDVNLNNLDDGIGNMDDINVNCLDENSHSVGTGCFPVSTLVSSKSH